MSKIRELRAIVDGGSYDTRTPGESFNETVAFLTDGIPLNEAYYGRKPVEPILKAMQKVRIRYLTDPNINMTNAPENKELEKAIEKTFGFRDVYVYWANGSDINNGPYTVPGSHIITTDGPYIKIGENRNGIYDKDHIITVGISSDLILFNEPTNLTAEEMVAVFIHEIGHNFDYTAFGIAREWYQIIEILIDAADKLDDGKFYDAVQIIASGVVAQALKSSPKLIIWITNLQDILLNAIPPIGRIGREIGTAIRPFTRMLDIMLGPFKWVSSMTLTLMRLPARMFSNFFLRKGETYADSFCAAYGYGSEQVTALQKMNYFMVAASADGGPVINVLTDLEFLRVEITQTLRMGHGSTQQRALRMLDVLNTDLQKANIPPAERRAIEKERDRMLATYNQFVSMSDTKRMGITQIFRTFIDNWYAGKPYALIPPLKGDYVD